MNEVLFYEFTKQMIKNQSRPKRFSFRDRFQHTKRVIEWARKIHKVEGGDFEVIHIAALFHDIGWDNDRDHGVVSREMAEAFLRDISYDTAKIEKILEAIEYHTHREIDKPLHLESYIVMDADILDEVGAVSILWDAMAAGMEEASSYEATYDRILLYTEKLKGKRHQLKTKAGRELFESRLTFIDQFLTELKYELHMC